MFWKDYFLLPFERIRQTKN